MAVILSVLLFMIGIFLIITSFILVYRSIFFWIYFDRIREQQKVKSIEEKILEKIELQNEIITLFGSIIVLAVGVYLSYFGYEWGTRHGFAF